MTSSKALVNHLKNMGVMDSKVLEEAFLSVDRRDFIFPEDRMSAYGDYPLPIGWGQTISQPFTVAFMLSLLDVRSGQTILDIGSGSAWTTALLAYLTGDTGRVKGLERIPELVQYGRANLLAYSFPWAEIDQASESLGDPGSQYERILVSASAPSFPDELIGQLKPEGIMVLPVKHSIWKIEKLHDSIREEEFYGFSFVPLL